MFNAMHYNLGKLVSCGLTVKDTPGTRLIQYTPWT